MKAKQSNTRIAFAYQVREPEAATLNPALDKSGSGYIIRVVQPAKGPNEQILRHPNFADGDSAKEHVGIDRLVSAHPVYIRKFKNPEAGNVVYATAYSAYLQAKSVTTVVPADVSQPVIVDIKIDDDGGKVDTALTKGHLLQVAIKLVFASGVVETLDLYLRKESELILGIDPREMSLEEPFTSSVLTPPGGTFTSGSLFSAYSIGKSYKSSIWKSTTLLKAYPSIGNRNGTDLETYATYTQPWGVISDDPSPFLIAGLVAANKPASDANLTYVQWATNNTGDQNGVFVTQHKSSLAWFSGNSDMSKIAISSTNSLAQEPEDSDAGNLDIDLRKFFLFRPPVKHITSQSDGLSSIFWPYGDPMWGQNFGWYTDWEGNFLKNRNGSDASYQINPGTGDVLLGIPMRGNKGDDVFGDSPRAGDLYDFKYDANSKSAPFFSGDFSANPADLSVDECFPSITAAQFGTTGTYSTIEQINGAQSVRVKKYTQTGQSATASSLTSYSLKDMGPLSGGPANHVSGSSLNAYDPFRRTGSTVGNTSTGWRMGQNSDLEGVKRGYVFYPTPSSTGQQDAYVTGSVKGICTNNANNFFYAGGVKAPGNNAFEAWELEPTFKGYIRNFAINRFGEPSSVETLAAVPYALAVHGVTQENAEFAHHMDLRGVIAGSIGPNRFGAIDLLANLLYNSTRVRGSYSAPLPQTSGINSDNTAFDSKLRSYGFSSLTTYWDNPDDISSLGSNFSLAAQDIVFLNSAINTVDATGSGADIGGYMAMHPIGSPLNKYPEKLSTPPNLAQSLNAGARTTAADSRYGPIPQPLTEPYFNEGVGNNLDCGYYPIVNSTNLTLNTDPDGGTNNMTRFRGKESDYKNVYHGSNLTQFQTALANYTSPVLPRVYAENAASYVATSGSSSENACFKVLSSSAEYKNVDPTTVFGEELVNHEITYRMIFTNSCTSGDFKTDAGAQTVTGGNLATRVTKVLEVFPHIELNTQNAYLTGQSVSSLGGEFAYKIVVTDENDVDDISITQVDGTSDQYMLTVVWRQDAADLYNNPGDDIEDDINIEGSQFIPDGEIKYIGGDDLGDIDGSSVVGYYHSTASEGGQDSYNKHKGTFITVSTDPNWRDNGDAGPAQNDVSTYYLAYHHNLIAYGKINEQRFQDDIDEETSVPGCTDSTAVNYNPDATTDDGSCYYCQDEANNPNGWDLQTNGLLYGSNGIRPGVYGNGYLFGLIGGADTQASVGFSNTGGAATTYFTPGATYGGAVVANNNYLGSQAVVNLSIKAGGVNSTSALNQMLTAAADYGNGEESWRLRILPASQDMLDQVDLTGSYSQDNPAPAILTGASAIYTADASAGTIYGPEWNNISTATSNLTGLTAGVPFLMELRFLPKNLPAGCTTYASGDAIVYGVFWVAFCSCVDIQNDFYSLALNGQGYPWNNTQSFPIVSYTGGRCPDVGGEPYGDNDYPASVCYRADDQATTCDGFFQFCVYSTVPECGSPSTLDSLDDAYQSGSQYFFDYTNFTTTILIESVYNSSNDTYQFDENLAFTVNVSGPDYNETLGNPQGVIQYDGAGQAIGSALTFENMTTPGDYTVTFTFPNVNGIYDGFEGEVPCIYTETITVQPPSEVCEEVILGCTDSTANNYDPLAVIDDGSCDYPPGCIEVYNNSALTSTASSTNSDTICVQDTFVVGTTTYTAEVPVFSNNGTVTVNVTYDAPTAVEAGGDAAVSEFAILLYPTSTSIPFFNTSLEINNAIFSSGIYPSSTELASSLTIDGEIIGTFSPLFVIGASDNTFEFVFENLPPNSYNFLAIPNLGDAALNDCSDIPFINLETEIQTVVVGANDPVEPCEENCIGSDCEDAKPGCTDPSANNYNPEATYDDGSCEYDASFCEDNSTSELCISCDDVIIQSAPRFVSGSLDETICDPVQGSDGECTDPNACNYNPDAPLELSNNQICDYCSCVPSDDPDCFPDDDCDPAEDPDCGPPEPECPDPGNPECDPTISDPCPSGDCGPPVPPCIVLGNCPEDGGDDGGGDDPFDWDEPVVELSCIPEVQGIENEEGYFDQIILSAFKCMSDEGKKMLFRMKAGAQYEEQDLIKLSLIAYLLNGGADSTDIPCIFNCNYDSAQSKMQFNGRGEWAKRARFWASTDTYAPGDIVVYYNHKNGKIKRSLYQAQRTVTPQDLLPPYMNSGWHRVRTVKTRTRDVNGISDGTETYLQTFYEFLTRFCTSCEIGAAGSQAAPLADNLVDPKIQKNYLDVRVDNNNNRPSGILGEDGNEIIF